LSERDRTTPERHELTQDELDHVSGGIVVTKDGHPPNPCMPAVGSVAGTGGSGAGKIDHSDFSISKVMDKASVNL
jgi:hypothetical protein